MSLLPTVLILKFVSLLGLYETHYKRLLEENKVLKVELAAYVEVGQLLQRGEKSWNETFEMFFKKLDNLEKYEQKLRESNRKLNEKKQQENQASV